MFGKLARTLYKMASVTNALNIYMSANPRRIMRHMLRKRVYKQVGKVGKYRK